MKRSLVSAAFATMFFAIASAQNPNWNQHWDFGVFGGGQWWKVGNASSIIQDRDMTGGGLLGGRLGYQFTPKWGVETSLANAFGHDEKFTLGQVVAGGRNQVAFGSRNLQWFAGPIYHLTERHRFRPFLTAGPALHHWSPTGDAKSTARGLVAPIGPIELSDNYSAAFHYGGGFKTYLTNRIHLRFDARGIVDSNARIRQSVTQTGQAFGRLGGESAAGNGLQLTAGIGFAPATPAFDLGPGLAVTSPNVTVTQGEVAKFTGSSNAEKTTYAWRIDGQPAGTGESINFETSAKAPGTYPVELLGTAKGKGTANATSTLTVVAPKPKTMRSNITAASNNQRMIAGPAAKFDLETDAPADATYQWFVDGKPVGTGKTLSISTAGMAPGEYPVVVRITAPGYEPTEARGILIIDAPQPPKVSIDAPSEIPAGESPRVSAPVTPGTAQAGSAKITVSEGKLNPDGTLDTSSIEFDPSIAGEQRKTVTITATVTDANGMTATSTKQVVVVKKARTAVRLPDLVFPVNNTRVNNCAKRVLLEELKAYLDKEPTGKVILIGHRDESEKAGMDRLRAQNAAAVITAGSGICLGVERSRVQLAAVATDNSNSPNPSFCGTSTDVKERAMSAIDSADDRAQFRRVEVWFVPQGAPDPDGAKGLKDAVEMRVEKLGCPK
jgi:outer membrane protein OmpA-like peptidoglycan-associated protein